MSLIHEMECSKCGRILYFQTNLHANGLLHVTVDPCQDCLDSIRTETVKQMEDKNG